MHGDPHQLKSIAPLNSSSHWTFTKSVTTTVSVLPVSNCVNFVWFVSIGSYHVDKMEFMRLLDGWYEKHAQLQPPVKTHLQSWVWAHVASK